MTPKERFAADLAKITVDKESHKIELAYFALDRGGLTLSEQLAFAQQLFAENWHMLHNDIAFEFQRAALPETASWIFDQVMGGKIPEVDDYLPIARVFTWALADIGGEQAWNYLQKIARSDNPFLVSYSRERLAHWNDELARKTSQWSVNGWSYGRIKTERYSSFIQRLPNSGRHIVAYQTEEDIIVYQAYNHKIADWAVKHQQLGGPAFSYHRMSWIKPNFLWMMYRCGWASKENQERVLAITIRKTDWEQILSHAVFSSYQPDVYESHDDWKSQLAASEVRLQWDPAHDPLGAKLDRKAIQIGMKGTILRKFGTEMIRHIDDVTEFVKWQKLYVDQNELDTLVVPKERVYEVVRPEIRKCIGL